MNSIDDVELMNEYVERYKINHVFTKDMSKHMELFLFKKNEYLCKEDEQIDYLFFLVDGKAKVYVGLKNGKSLLLCFYSPFMMLGDLELINGEKATTSTQVIEETYCIGMRLDKVRDELINDSKFLRFICDSLGSKLERSSKNGSINLLYPLENRLASYIMATKEEVNRSTEKIWIFDENLTEISELLGTSYRHLLRTLNKWVTSGVIKKSGHFYEIIDEKLIKNLAIDLYK
ncbi:MAG: transcriptional regulator YeiL [Clostridium sp.]|uniref:transcriptional regulator YeiL n=1 Tax=Clostridium sp. TaxID=1506 RepID=UPI00302E452D